MENGIDASDGNNPIMETGRSPEPSNPGQSFTLATHVANKEAGEFDVQQQDSTGNVDPEREEEDSVLGASPTSDDSSHGQPGHAVTSIEPIVDSEMVRERHSPRAECRPQRLATRKRAAKDDDTSEDELTPLPKSKAARKTASSAGSTINNADSSLPIPKSWRNPNVVTSSRSPLTKIDLVSLLQQDSAWTVLSAEAQLRLLTTLGIKNPERLDDGSGKYKNYAAELFEESEALRNDVQRFEGHLKEGRMDPDWQAQAEAAGEARRRGELSDEEGG
ncbi:hypothetical protein EJ08DRAFT_736266 [Tothia fuscella]|uniref:ASX DEUBAD domain-containing protein n=1 Tax=Tothia fuscella TaxID=1048955 RepID=A0A9P4NLX1_9PEZI|nr:hypothetical protein EJ08DRAFT_736266 [Tothia fuscella]